MRTDEVLFKLLERYTDAKGGGRLVLMVEIRQFLMRQPLYEVISAVDLISDQKWLNVLMGAGLRGQLYYAVILRKAKLEGMVI